MNAGIKLLIGNKRLGFFLDKYSMWYHIPTSIVLNVGRGERYKFGDCLWSAIFSHPKVVMH